MLVEQQLWTTPDGPVTQYAATLPHPVVGAMAATERAIYDDVAALIAGLRSERGKIIASRDRARTIRAGWDETSARADASSCSGPHPDVVVRDEIQSATVRGLDVAIAASERHATEIEERLALADDLARWAGDAAEAAHDEDVASQPEGRHYTYCCMQAREDGERNEYAFAMELPLEQLRRRHSAELEERAIERARREGVIR